MIDEKRIRQVIQRAMERVNEAQPDDLKLEFSDSEVFYGPGGKLDSIGLIQLIGALEDEVRKEFSAEVAVADENVLTQGGKALSNIPSLVEHLRNLLRKAGYE